MMDIWHHVRCWRPGGGAVPPDAWRSVMGTTDSAVHREPWNKGKIVALKVRDVCHGDQVATRAIVMQHKTQRPVQFEITQATRDALQAWMQQAGLKSEDYLFPSRLHGSPHLGTRQYARILGHWVDELGLDRAEYGTHSMRRTKATLIYRRTKNLRAVQLLLGHSKLESSVRYLGIEVDDALEISEQTET
jgi:integrase